MLSDSFLTFFFQFVHWIIYYDIQALNLSTVLKILFDVFWFAVLSHLIWKIAQSLFLVFIILSPLQLCCCKKKAAHGTQNAAPATPLQQMPSSGTPTPALAAVATTETTAQAKPPTPAVISAANQEKPPVSTFLQWSWIMDSAVSKKSIYRNNKKLQKSGHCPHSLSAADVMNCSV